MREKDHKKNLPTISALVVTVSDSSYYEDAEDISGPLIVDILKKGHISVDKKIIIPDEEKKIAEIIENASEDIIVLSGGTGISKRDITIDTVKKYVSNTIEGFGEIFRIISFNQVGTRAILSRAMAGIYKDKIIFCIPGSPNAAKTGAEIIAAEAAHMIKHLRN